MYDENAKQGFTFSQFKTTFKPDVVEAMDDIPNYATVNDKEYAACYGIRPCDVKQHITTRFEASIRGMRVEAYYLKTLSQCDEIAALEHAQFIEDVFGLTL